VALSPFVLHVARLRRQSGARTQELLEGPFDPEEILAPKGEGESGIAPGTPATVKATLHSFEGGVMVAVTVDVPWVGCCRRCGVPIKGELHAFMKERYCEPGVGYSDPDDDESFRIEDDTLDLTPMLIEAVALELPMAPLCRPDCAGLCPHCGVDKNTESCSCEAPIDPRWASLSGLGTSSEAEGEPVE
jgi:uncharacterized protein